MGKSKCPICGSDNISVLSVTETFKYKSREITIPNYKVDHCYGCGEEFIIPSEYNRVGKQIKVMYFEEDLKDNK